MQATKNYYIAMAVLGILVPWYFFSQFIAEHGINFVDFLQALFVNGAAGGFSSDIFISATVFWVWSYQDAKTTGVRNWWPVIPATIFVGLSLALPMYFLFRLKAEND